MYEEEEYFDNFDFWLLYLLFAQVGKVMLRAYLGESERFLKTKTVLRYVAERSGRFECLSMVAALRLLCEERCRLVHEKSLCTSVQSSLEHRTAIIGAGTMY